MRNRGATSPAAAEIIRQSHRYILKDSEELARDVDSGVLEGRPYWDPALRGSRARMREFLRILDKANLAT